MCVHTPANRDPSSNGGRPIAARSYARCECAPSSSPDAADRGEWWGKDWECGTSYALEHILVRRSSFLDSVVYRVSLGLVPNVSEWSFACDRFTCSYISIRDQKETDRILTVFLLSFPKSVSFFEDSKEKVRLSIESSLDSSLEGSEETRTPVKPI